MKNQQKGRTSTYFLLVLLLLTGLVLLAYPTVSDYWNSLRQTKAISGYTQAVAQMDHDAYAAYWEAADAFNDNIKNRSNPYVLSEEEKIAYYDALNLDGSGIMGYIEIPSIGVQLPIAHGTSDTTLQTMIGHMMWTSLPSGGEGTHTVLSGHRGLPSARLFTDLDKLVEGDTFMLVILDQVLTYEIDQITIVEPNYVTPLHIVPNEDYCTLVTCTPYGINSHRLLVRGHRIETTEAAHVVRVPSDALVVSTLIVALMLSLPLAVIFLASLGIDDRLKRKADEEDFESDNGGE